MNVKLENNLPKDIKVKINNNEDYTLISKLLKLENFITEEENITKYNVSNSLYNIDIFYEKQVTEEELKLKEKQIESLKQSIERRKKLLSNENYVAKAPKQLVETEKQKLEEEENALKQLVK